MTIDEQIILYSKGWYGYSEDGYLEDISVLIKRYSMIKPSDNDVRKLIIAAFAWHVTKPLIIEETLLEAFGWHFGRESGLIRDRSPEACLLGKLSILEGTCVDLENLYSDIFFGSDQERKRLKHCKARNV